MVKFIAITKPHTYQRFLDGYGYQKIVGQETEFCVLTQENEAHCFSEQRHLHSEDTFIDIDIGCGLTSDNQVYCFEGGTDTQSTDGSMVMIDNDGDGDSFGVIAMTTIHTSMI